MKLTKIIRKENKEKIKKKTNIKCDKNKKLNCRVRENTHKNKKLARKKSSFSINISLILLKLLLIKYKKAMKEKTNIKFEKNTLKYLVNSAIKKV